MVFQGAIKTSFTPAQALKPPFSAAFNPLMNYIHVTINALRRNRCHIDDDLLCPGGTIPLVDSGIFRILPQYLHLWIPDRYLAFWRGRVYLEPAGVA